MIVWGAFGAFLGGNIKRFDLFLTNFGQGVTAFLIDNSFETMVITTLGILILAWACYFNSKRLYSRYQGEENEALFGRIDRYLSWALMLSTLCIIVIYMLFGICVSLGDQILASAGFTICAAVFTIYCQVVFVRFTKVLYPDKKGNPLDASFTKDWMQSCDEAEKYTIYRSSYHTFNLMKMVYLVTMGLLIAIGVTFDIGILPFVLVGALWGIESIAYMVIAEQHSSSKLNE